MTRIVDQLVESGLVEKEPAPGDARRTLVRATAAGVALTAEGRRRRVASLSRDLEALPVEELATLEQAAEILERVVGRSHP